MRTAIRKYLAGRGAKVPAMGSGMEGGEEELRNLGADILGVVFSYLPPKDVCEVLLVSKYWGKTALECVGLWKKLRVHGNEEGRNWREDNIVHRLIGIAEDVTFSTGYFCQKTTRVYCH